MTWWGFNLRVSVKIPVVDGFNQLLRHLYYLLFTSWQQTETEPEEVTDCQKSFGGWTYKRCSSYSPWIYFKPLTFELSSSHGQTPPVRDIWCHSGVVCLVHSSCLTWCHKNIKCFWQETKPFNDFRCLSCFEH